MRTERDPRLAPPDMLEVVAVWRGTELDGDASSTAKRDPKFASSAFLDFGAAWCGTELDGDASSTAERDPKFASSTVLDLGAGWLGITLDESKDEATNSSTHPCHATDAFALRGAARASDYSACMGRALKRQVQQEIRWPNKAGDLRGRKREAKPRGKRHVGRPKKPGAGMSHAKRPALKAREPIHITVRVVDVIGRLRTRSAYMAIREAAIAVFRREDFRIIHMSIEGTHIHLLVEADDRHALSNGMRAFQGSAAKHLNAACSKAGSWWERKRAARLGHALPERRKGRVFTDRYHETVITTPKQARHALAYVLNNWRRHREDRAKRARGWRIDPFATGWAFDGWKERADTPFAWKVRETYKPIPVWLPRTWLLREGWQMHGLIGLREVPGPQAGPGAPVLAD